MGAESCASKEMLVRGIAAALLITALDTAFVPRAAFAMTNMYTRAPGLVSTDEGDIALPDTLLSTSRDTVEDIALVLGEQTTLKGGYRGGWGKVELRWEHAALDGAADSYVDPASLDMLAWETISEDSMPGTALIRNDALRTSKAQELKVAPTSAGVGAWRLTVADEAGYTHTSTWVLTVTSDVLELMAFAADTAEESSDGSSPQTTVMVEVRAPKDAGAPEEPKTVTPPSTETSDKADAEAQVQTAQHAQHEDTAEKATAKLRLPQTSDLSSRDRAMLAMAGMAMLVVGMLLRLTRGESERS